MSDLFSTETGSQKGAIQAQASETCKTEAGTPRFADGKSPDAFRTIGEVAKALSIRPHVLRYWEEQFPQLRPVKRGGGRRYYRPEDVSLLKTIDRLVHRDGYTLRGARQWLETQSKAPSQSGREAVSQTSDLVTSSDVTANSAVPVVPEPVELSNNDALVSSPPAPSQLDYAELVQRLFTIRNHLAEALDR